MIKWYRRHKCRKFMRDAFRLSRYFIANCNEKNCKELINVLEELVDNYENKYGVDDISFTLSRKIRLFSNY